MAFLKLNEYHGNEVLVNLDRVIKVTKESGGSARLWYSADDRDTVAVEQAFEYVQAELFHSGNLMQAMGIGNGY